MKRQNSISWKEDSDTPKKKRSRSLNIPKTPVNKKKEDEVPKSFSKIKKLLSLESEDDKNKETHVKIDVSSIPGSECFSEINTNIKLIVDSIIHEESCLILNCKDYKIILKDDWKDLIIHKGMKISIFDCPCCDTSISCKDIIIDNKNHIMLIDDDIIPVTTYCEAFNCIYKPLFKEKILDVSFQYSHSSMAVGVIIHSVIQSCLKQNNFTLKFIVDRIKITIAENTSLLYACNLTSKHAMLDCTKFITNIMKLKEQERFANCYAVEKKMVSQKYNLRGNIDAILIDQTNQIPLEIKTGKRVDFKHYAQIILYLLMLREKNMENTSYGLLCYIKEGLIKKINLKHSEVMALCILRNEIASVRYEIKEKIKTNRNFVSYPGQFTPTCKCEDVEYCRTLQCLFESEGFKGDFLREQWMAINDEEEIQKQVDLYPCTYVEQKEHKIVLKVDTQDINKIKEFLEIYDINKNRICFAKLEKIENDNVFLTLNASYNLLCYYNLYLCNTKNELFYKTMRFSLLNIAIISEVFDLDLTSQNDKKYNCVTSSAEKYLEFLTQLESEEETNSDTELIPQLFERDFFDLNQDQRSALHLALNCKKYHLIHGFPGTGKSHLIRLLIKIMCFTKKKVLLICYTNLALDNIINNLPVKYYRALKDTNKFADTEVLKKYLDSIELVVGTCFSFTDIVFLQRKFDYCIIDEASQQHFLLTLIPISLSKRFLLVGDHLQLKPISVQNRCLEMSLFEYLIKTHRSELTLQYRMPNNIMKISNKMFYNDKMKGINKSGIFEFINTNDGYIDILQNIVKQYKPSAEAIVKDNISKNVLDSLKLQQKNGTKINYIIEKGDLTILCYFNTTVSFVRNITNEHVNVQTIDKFQGSEAKHIIVIFDPITDCEIMNSKERLNVALTRSKERLTLVGSSTKMQAIPILDQLLKVIKDLNL